jgi:hypothetical protein
MVDIIMNIHSILSYYDFSEFLRHIIKLMIFFFNDSPPLVRSKNRKKFNLFENEKKKGVFTIKF